MPIEAGVPEMVHELLAASIMIVGGMAIIAAIDVPFQLWQYYKKLRMTKEELKQEGKEQEGNPEVKGRIRRQQMEAARRRMMQDVPKADVVVTNPTHYAVALKYDSNRMAAPQSRGQGHEPDCRQYPRAGRGAQCAGAGSPTAGACALQACRDRRAGSIRDLYTAVAEVMAYVYQLAQYLVRQGMTAPDMPRSRDRVP